MADSNLISQALSRGYSIDEIADRLGSAEGLDVDEIRGRGYSSREIVERLGYEIPAPKEKGFGEKLADAIGWNKGRDITVPDSIKRDASQPIEEEAPKKLRNSVMNNYEPEQKPLIERRGAPVTEETAEKIRRTYEANPGKRALLTGRDDWVGSVAKSVESSYADQDANTPESRVVRKVDRRVENRRARLIKEDGYGNESADLVAKQSAQMGMLPGTESTGAMSEIETDNTWGDAGAWGKPMTVAAGEVGSTGATLSDVGRRLNIDSVTELGDSMQRWADRKMPQNPTFADQVAQGFGSMASFYIPGLGVAKGARALEVISPALAKWTGAGVMAGLEAAAESDNTYKALLKQGVTEEEAANQANAVFVQNLALLGVTDKMGFFNDLRVGWEKGGKQIAKDIATKAVVAKANEGGQEFGQQIIQNTATGRPTFEGAGEAAAIGAIVGGGSSVTQSLLETPMTKNAQLGQALLDSVENSYFSGRQIDAAVREGLSPAYAQLQRIADSPQETANFLTAQDTTDDAITAFNVLNETPVTGDSHAAQVDATSDQRASDIGVGGLGNAPVVPGVASGGGELTGSPVVGSGADSSLGNAGLANDAVELDQDLLALEQQTQASSEEPSPISPADALRRIAEASESVTPNHPSVPSSAVADGTWGGSGALNLDANGNVILQRVAGTREALTKEGARRSTLEDLHNQSLYHGGGIDSDAISTSGNADFTSGYGLSRFGSDRTVGTFTIPFNDLIGMIQRGEATIGNIGEGEILLSGAAAAPYLTHIDGNAIQAPGVTPQDSSVTMNAPVNSGESNGVQNGAESQAAGSPERLALGQHHAEVLRRTFGDGASVVTPLPVRDVAGQSERATGLRGVTGIETGRLVGAISGRELVLYEAKHGAHDGFIIDKDPRFVYLNVESYTNPLSTAIHEVTHAMERDVPDAYNGFVGAVSNVVDISDDALLRFAQDYNFKHFKKEIIERRLNNKQNPETAGEILDDLIASNPNLAMRGGRQALISEFYADLMGRASEHADTWRMVTEEMARQDPSILRKFLNKIESIANSLRKAFAGKNGFEHMDKYVLGKTVQELDANLKVIRRAAAVALARYSGRNQAARDALFADRNGEVVASQARSNGKSTRIRRTVQELVDAAESQSNWKTWYARHEQTLLDTFGDDADLFQKLLSATSQATGVKGNVSLALKAYEQLLSGKPFQGYLPAVIKNLERIRNDEKLSGRKISQYGEANEGNTEAIAVDRHIAMLFFNTKSPTPRQIEVAKIRIRKVADRLGWEPRQVQAALWAYNQVIRGTDPEKVESYDKILEARAEQIQALRAKLGRGEAGSVRTLGGSVEGAERGTEVVPSAVRPDRKVDPDKIPEFRFEDHIGREMFATIADRTASGGTFEGIDSSTTDPIPLQGGPGFPLLERNYSQGVVWANDGKAITSKKANLIDKHGKPLMAVSLGQFDMHSSNATAVMAYLKTLEAYIRDGRVNPADLSSVAESIRNLKLPKEYRQDELATFPGFEDPAALDAYINDASFPARAAIVKELGKARSEQVGLPSADKLIRKLADKAYAGSRHFDTVLVLEPHDEDAFVTLGEEGTDKHLSYAYGVRGKIVGKLTTPINAREIWADWFEKKYEEKLAEKRLMQDVYEGRATLEDLLATVKPEDYRNKSLYRQAVKSLSDQYEKVIKNPNKLKNLLAGNYDALINLDRSFSMATPVVKITPELAQRMDALASKPVPNAATAKAAMSFIKGEWRTSDESVKNGGVSPADFARELRQSDYAATLTLYSEEELVDAQRGWKKDGKKKVATDKMRLFKLGDSRIQFALKYGVPETYGVTIDGVSDNEVSLVSVVNNEPGVSGIAGPAILTKAIEEGATFLDCYAVPSKNFPDGFLPTLYAEYGFREVARVDFDPQYLTEDHKYAWRQHGWKDGDPLPQIVLMKWEGNENERAGLQQRYVEQGTESLRRLSVRASAAAGTYADKLAGEKARRVGRKSDSGSGNRGVQDSAYRASLASRAYSTIEQVRNLDADQRRNLGIVASPERSGAGDEGGEGSAGAPGYGTGQPGSVSLTAVHYSKAERNALAGYYYGQGMKGAEKDRLNRDSATPDQRRRIHYYVDEGSGIRPESDVGDHAHATALGNLYNWVDDPLNLWSEARDAYADPADRYNKMEQLIMARGFDGLYGPKAQGNQGVVVLLGPKHVNVPVLYLGTGYRGGKFALPAKAAPAQKTDADRVEEARVLPMGQMTGADWKRMIPLVVPGADVSMLEDGQRYYKSQVVSAMRDEVVPSPSRAPAFYSQLARSFEQAPDRIFGPAQQVKAWLASNAAKLGIKQDEIQWTGINDYLDLQGKTKVAKQQVLDYLAQGGVKVEEVMKGSRGFSEKNPSLPESGGLDVVPWENLPDDAARELEDKAVYGRYVVLDNMDTPLGIGPTEADAINDAYSGYPHLWDTESSTKYGDYTLPGGENYRELLLTLPSNVEASKAKHKSFLQSMKDKYGDDGTLSYAKKMTPEEKAEAKRLSAYNEKFDYRSGHWDEANILAHIRFNDRTDAHGAKVLFIEEVQSDWGQDGKKKGFGDGKNGLLKAIRENIPSELWGNGDFYDSPESFARDFVQAGGPRRDAIDAMEEAGIPYDVQSKLMDIEVRTGGFVPQAPFVTKTEAWVDLALKRIAMYAVEHGYDKVAFVNGQQSADRYDLSKQVDQIAIGKYGDGYQVIGRKSGEVLVDRVANDANELESLVGKEIAAKHIENGQRSFSGLDLQIGGTGMKTFYDAIVPQRVKEVLKKLGGGKLETVTIGQETGDVFHGKEKVASGIERSQYESEWGDGYRFVPVSDSITQPGFTITPAMREKVSAGVPLFSPSRQPVQATWSVTPTGKIDSIIYESQNKLIDLKRVRDTIRESGIQIRDNYDAYLAEELFHGRAAYRVQLAFETEFQPLLTEMKLRGIEVAEFDKYLHARHAKERNAAMAKANPNQAELDRLIIDAEEDVKDANLDLQQAQLSGQGVQQATWALQRAMAKLNALMTTAPFSGTEEQRQMLSGMSNQEASAILRGLGNRRATFDALGRRIDQIVEENRRLMEQYGLETSETVDALRQAYQHYVPLLREMDDSDLLGTGGSGTGAGYSVKGSTLKRATGSLRTVESPLAHLIAQREQIVVRGEKAMVGKALYGMALSAPNPDFWTVIRPNMSAKELRRSMQAAGMDPALIKAMEDAPMDAYLDEASGTVKWRVNPLLARDEMAFVVRVAGQDRIVLFNRNNDRAVRLAQALKNADSIHFKGWLGSVDAAVGMVTRYISAVNTQYNPIFGIKNFVRDLQGAVFNLATTPLKGQELQITKNVGHALRAIWREERGKSAANQVWADAWQELQEEGGLTGYRDQYNGIEDRIRVIQRMVAPGRLSKAAHKSGAAYLLDLLSDYNTAIESGIRLSAYKAARDAGLSKKQAASIAKNLTVNFNRKGRTGGKLSGWYAFFNAAIQGNARILETAQGGYKGRAAAHYATKFVSAGATIGAVLAMIGIALMGDDWDDIPDFIRDRDLIIPLGKMEITGTNVKQTKSGSRYLHIPMALGFHILPAIGRTIVETAYFGEPGKRMAHLLGVAVEGMNPMGSSNSLVEFLAPSFMDPAIQLATNQNAFGRPIAKQNFSERDPTPAPDRAFKSASTVGKVVSKALDRISGGDGIDPGRIQATPDQVDFVFGQLTGGVGRETLKLYQYLESFATGEKIPESRVPIAGMFYGETKSEQNVTGKFYDLETRVNIAKRELQARVSDDAKKEFLKDSPEARVISHLKAAEAQLQRLQKARKAADKRGDNAEVKRLDNLANHVRISFIEAFDTEKAAK